MAQRSRNQPLGLAERTRKNLDFVIKAWERGEDVHPVTQLTNSLLALIVFPWEKRIADHVLNVRLEELPSVKWPKWKMKHGQPKTLRDLLDRIRNAIGHGNITYSSESRHLEDVEIELSDLGKSGKDLKWIGQINGAHLLAFSLAFIELLEAASPDPRQLRGLTPRTS